MKFRWSAKVAALVMVGAFGCADKHQDPFFTESEWAIIKTLSPLPDPPIDTTNKYEENPAAAALGQQFFFETKFQDYGLEIGTDGCQQPNDARFPNNCASPPPAPQPYSCNPPPPTTGWPPAPKPGVSSAKPSGYAPGGDLPCGIGTAKGVVGATQAVQCNSCHIAATWFNDNGPLNVSVAVTYSFRNDPSLVNAVYYKFMGWAGTGENPWVQAITTDEASQMGADRLGIAHRVYAGYKDSYNAIFAADYGPLPDALDKADTSGRFPAQGRPGNPGNGFGAELDAKGNISTTDPVIAGWINAWSSMQPEDQEIANRIEVNVFKAVAAYLHTLISRNARFDQVVAGQFGAMTAQEKNGLRLFIGKASCISCHNTPFFTDNGYHAIAVPRMPDLPPEGTAHFGTITGFAGVLNYLKNPSPSTAAPIFWSGMGPYSDDPDGGKQKLIDAGLINKDGTAIASPPLSELGRYRTKTLRQIANTAPYMHNGYFAKLWDVVDFYNNGGGTFNEQNSAESRAGTTPVYGYGDYKKDGNLKPLGLTASEEDDLVAFLGSLTGDAIADSVILDTHPAK